MTDLVSIQRLGVCTLYATNCVALGDERTSDLHRGCQAAE